MTSIKTSLNPQQGKSGEQLESTAKVARLLLAPIEYLAAQSDRWQRYLQRIADQVPEERRVEAHPQVSGPVLEGLRYVDEHSIIADLFINLLARAVDRDRVSEAHPAFSNIIAQLSADEALIIFWLQKKRYLYRTYIPLNPEAKGILSNQAKVIENEFPTDKLIFPENFAMYIDHLDSLNLAELRPEDHSDSIFDEEQPTVQIGLNIPYSADLTPFGRMFAQACVPEELPASTSSGLT